MTKCHALAQESGSDAVLRSLLYAQGENFIHIEQKGQLTGSNYKHTDNTTHR